MQLHHQIGIQHLMGEREGEGRRGREREGEGGRGRGREREREGRRGKREGGRERVIIILT